MQKYIWVGLLLLIATGVSSLSAQQEQSSKKSHIQNTVVKSETPPIDPKLTGIEREMQAGTLHTNPAKIATPTVDTKLQAQGEWPTEAQAAPAKPGIIPVDSKLEDENQTGVVKPENTQETRFHQAGYDASIDPNTGQKMDTPASKVTNYRELKGEKEQPIPEAQPGIINYRNLQGERTQPPGEKSK